MSDDRFWSRVDKSGECWVWTGARVRGDYGMASYFRADVGEALAHRIAWQLTNGPIPRGMYVCHRCDNPPCVRPDHLFLGTQWDNSRDMREKGRSMTGERNPHNKLTADQVAEIRASDLGDTALSRMYGVNRSHIWRLRHHRVWA